MATAFGRLNTKPKCLASLDLQKQLALLQSATSYNGLLDDPADKAPSRTYDGSHKQFVTAAHSLAQQSEGTDAGAKDVIKALASPEVFATLSISKFGAVHVTDFMCRPLVSVYQSSPAAQSDDHNKIMMVNSSAVKNMLAGWPAEVYVQPGTVGAVVGCAAVLCELLFRRS